MSTGKERLPPVEKDTSDQKLFPSVVTGGFRQSASTGNSSKTFEYLNDKWNGRFRIVLDNFVRVLKINPSIFQQNLSSGATKICQKNAGLSETG